MLCLRKTLFLVYSLFLYFLSVSAEDSLHSKMLAEETKKSKTGVVKITGEILVDVIRKEDKETSLVTLLTANDDRFGCSHCLEITKYFEEVAVAWKKNQKIENLFFTVIDAADDIKLFRQLGVRYPPKIIAISDNLNPSKSSDRTAELPVDMITSSKDLARMLQDLYGVEFGYEVKVDFSQYFKMAGYTALALAFAYYLFKNAEKTEKLLRNLISAGVMLFCVFMLSGYMWNTIKNPPYQGRVSKETGVFAKGTSEQYGIETNTMAMLYGINVILVAFLSKRVPAIEKKPLQIAMAILVMAALLITNSYIYRNMGYKSQGYPFRILF